LNSSQGWIVPEVELLSKAKKKEDVNLAFFLYFLYCHPCSPYHFKMPAKKIKVSHTLAALKSIQFTLHQEDLPGISAFNVREFWGSPRELEKAASRSHTGTKFIGQIEAGGD